MEALAKELAKFPLLFTKALFFGDRPSSKKQVQINNGSASLIDLGKGVLCLTCYHVLSEYRKKMQEDDNLTFQIGHTEIDPLAQLIDENERLDIAILELSKQQTEEICNEGEIGSSVFSPRKWPPSKPNIGDFVSFGGFPGAFRKVISFDKLVFYSWSCGASEVSSVSDYVFYSRFEREYWAKSFGELRHMGFSALGGMSGGPVFILLWQLNTPTMPHRQCWDL